MSRIPYTFVGLGLLGMVLWAWTVPTSSQAPIFCPERGANDNSNACASTSYVDRAIGGVVGGINQLTGDVTAGPGTGSQAATLATVNANVGSFGSGTLTPTFTVNGKGLLTAAGTVTTAPPFSAVTGTLANSQLTGVQNTVKGAATSAVETDLSVPSCSAATSALTWTTNTGFGCNTISAGTGTLVSVQFFAGSTTITIPTGATKVLVRMWGGTGGSGGIGNSSGGGTGGSGAAGYLEKYLTSLTPGNTLVWTQGAAGAAGGINAAGGNGTASSLASGTQIITTLTANGSNGSAGVLNGSSAGTAGGTATNGDVNITGAAGQDGFIAATSLNTGNSVGGAPGGSLFAPGTPGQQGNNTTGIAGRAGGSIFMWFTWNFAPANDNHPMAAVA